MDQREVVLYAHGRCLRCWRAKRFLRRRGYHFEVIDATGDPGLRAGLSEVARRKVAPPYVFVDRRPLGGLGTIRALAGSGTLEHLVRGDL